MRWGLIFWEHGVGVYCGMMPEISNLVKDFNGIRLVMDFDLDCGRCDRRSRRAYSAACYIPESGI